MVGKINGVQIGEEEEEEPISSQKKRKQMEVEHNEPLVEEDLKINDLAEFRKEESKIDREGRPNAIHISWLTLKFKGELGQISKEELLDDEPIYKREERLEIKKGVTEYIHFEIVNL